MKFDDYLDPDLEKLKFSKDLDLIAFLLKVKLAVTILWIIVIISLIILVINFDLEDILLILKSKKMVICVFILVACCDYLLKIWLCNLINKPKT